MQWGIGWLYIGEGQRDGRGPNGHRSNGSEIEGQPDPRLETRVPDGVPDGGRTGARRGCQTGAKRDAQRVARRGARRGQTGATSSATSFLNAMSPVEGGMG
jgi:hypothetical protein